MSFKATIKEVESKQIWCKAIYGLSSISDNLKFVITSRFLSISALNTSHTSNFDTFYSIGFFSNYDFKFGNIDGLIQEGFTFHDAKKTPENSSYSFIIQAKFLSVLFKSLNDDEEVTISVNFQENSPKSHKFRLLIEKTSKRSVKKQFSPGFQPCWLDNKDISKIYKNRLKNLWTDYSFDTKQELFTNTQQVIDEENDDEPVNYLTLDNLIIKKFLEVTPSSIEDFQINIKRTSHRLFFIAFLKPIKKDKVYIRQPMSLCVSISMDDIIDSFFHQPNKTVDEDIRVTFRLKELKTFVGLSSMWLTDNNNGEFNDEGKNFQDFNNESTGENNNFEIFFEKNGSPIVFESILKRGLVKIKLTQLTDVDENLSIDQGDEMNSKIGILNRSRNRLPTYNIIRTKKKPQVKPTTILEKNNNEEEDYHYHEDTLMNLLDNHENENESIKHHEPLFVEDDSLPSLIEINKWKPQKLQGRSTISFQQTHNFEENLSLDEKEEEDNQPTITWNTRNGLTEDEDTRKKRLLYSSINVINNNDEEEEEEGIGRTQQTKKPKGIFD